MVTSKELLERLGRKLDEQTPILARLDGYYLGTQPAAYLSPASALALGNRLRVLAVNFPSLVVGSLAERLTVAGFRTEGPENQPDAALWALWRANGLDDASAQAHTDALVYGRSFAVVWADNTGRPVVTIESAKQVAVQRDPATRRVTAAVKRWVEPSETGPGRQHAVVYEPDRITRYSTDSPDAPTMSGAWTSSGVLANPLGVVPVVPIVNRGRLLDVDGVSEMAGVLDLADALNKLMCDSMVTSEFYARPRRWATGMEIVEDDDGNAINPFSDSPERVWQSEAPETKFGQFDAARLDGYADLAAVLTQQIGAISALPPHYLGLHGDQPASADAIRSAEASLVARAVARQRTFGQAWADVARLIIAVRDGTDPSALDVETVWANPETRTPAQAADAAAKLHGIGVPLPALLADQLGYSPAQVQRVLDTQPTNEGNAA